MPEENLGLGGLVVYHLKKARNEIFMWIIYAVTVIESHSLQLLLFLEKQNFAHLKVFFKGKDYICNVTSCREDS